MKVLHLTSLFPYSGRHLHDGAGGHAVFDLVDNLRREMGEDSQQIYFYHPFLAPYYGFISKSKSYNYSFRGPPWYPNMLYRPMVELPRGFLRCLTRPLWQRLASTTHTQTPKYDLIHLHTSLDLGILAARIKKTSNKKLIVTIRREFHDKTWERLSMSDKNSARTAIQEADAITSASTVSALNVKKLFQKEVSVIPNGTSSVFDFFTEGAERNLKTILFVGTLDKNKNVLLLIRVFKDILREEPESKLKIIGSGPLESTVQREVDGYNNIEFMGRLSKEGVRSEMCRAGILCVPSYTETFGIVYAEAMKQEMAVVTRSGTGIDGHGIRGRHYELIDHDDELGDVLLTLLRDRKRCEILGKMGRKLAMSWNWKSCARQYIEIYGTVNELE